MVSDEPTQADIESAAEQQDEHFQRLFGPDWALMPTSVRLRETQEALAKSQQDLTRSEAKREKALAEGDALTVRLLTLRGELAEMTEARDCAREQLRVVAGRHDEALHEVAHLKFQVSMKQAQIDHLRAERDAAYELAAPTSKEPTA